MKPVPPPVIRALQSYGVGQSIREDGPSRHQGKGGTPTMGGILILFAVLMSTLLWTDLTSRYVWLAIFAMLGFGIVGFCDDYLKTVRGKNQGLTAAQKIIAQAEAHLDGLNERRERRLRELDRERHCTVADITHLGRAWVMPHPERNQPENAVMVRDPEIERIILKSLSKRPEDRYQTGAEFDRELILVANRLCGPNWVHALEPGADLAAMVPPALDRTMVLPTRAPGVASAAAPVPSSPAYAPRPPQRAVPAPPGGPNRVLVGGIVAAVLVVAAIVAVVALGGRPASGPSTPTATDKAPGVASCDYLRTGVAPAAGAGGTCGLKLGNQVQADSMAGLSALPADLRPIGVDSNMAPNRTLPNVPVSGGFATLAAPSKGAGPALTTNLGPVDEVVIADFTPTSTADADIGVGLRCSTTDCLLVYVSPAGSVWISQRTAGKELAQKFKDSAQVPVNQVNRLVVVVKGSQVQAWLNGNLVGTVSTDVAGAGTAIFYNVDQDSRPSTVNLSDFYVFQPS